jgi:hypothetical protein
MNKSTQILSGKFSAGEGKKGNFTGYNAKGEKIFVHKAQMETLGFKENKDVKPFFAVIGEREIQLVDDNNEPTGKTAMRTQALSVFKDSKSLIEAVNSDAVLELQAKAALKAEATSVGLSEKALSALLEASI